MTDLKMFSGRPPKWSLSRPKSVFQHLYDLVGAPLRMVALPDHVNERLHLTSLRAERLSAVLPQMKGRVLDIGAGDNMLINLYREASVDTSNEAGARDSKGLDVVDWGGDCIIVENCRHLPFEDRSFDTVCFVACLNHIPERKQALAESWRILKPGGRLIVTMIGRLIGEVGHAIWWYSEDKHRDVAEGEVMGMDPTAVSNLIREAGFPSVHRSSFVYGLNHLFVANKPISVA
ncbi:MULTISPECIES: class I SAM-dependent methyltransferase [Rhizobium]|uniref:class I SAM-dependent methyltransferase n=1 Tax=Rhizobium TaxID=379 RepID=UPI0013E2A66F|nr:MULTISPECIES: class I SAM-dependent methyltransferase [Rhizobium]WSH28324.1 class I SAM-dependent methyltransferase [Rhizobium beringeri]WSH81357.1 class I SAM-dependent methyltransferase [Rhizobium beringeri]